MTAPALSRTVDVETPELVVLSYTIAGVGSRAAAALIDYLICALTFIGLLIAMATFSVQFFGGAGGNRANPDDAIAWGVALLGFVQFAILWLYYLLFEVFMDGQTPGKRLMKLRVVRDGGLSVTFGASAIRNLVRIVDMQPFIFYLTGIVSLVVTRHGKRLGDLAAGTIVVREEIVKQPVTEPSVRKPAGQNQPALHAALTDAEYDVLDRFMQRRMDLDAQRREAFAAQLIARFSQVTQSPADDGNVVVQLAKLHEQEKAARAQGVAARHDTGAARERHAIVAGGASRWSTFAERVRRAQGSGLASLGEKDVREFVQEYREVSADLARLRTATRGREANEVFYLNRLVATAHNLLYRRTNISPQRAVTYCFVDVPREIRASRLPILLAAAMLFIPMAIAGTAVVKSPSVAQLMLPASMLDRAERGLRAAQTGGGYIEDPEILRPVMASRIITNNVQVAFMAFAAGITAGVFTFYVLLTNGVSIGSVFGLYISKGIGELLFAFVAPHGVLELTAIVIAGGAGLLLGSALLVPGNRTRREALVANGRRAIDLIAGATLLLLAAGVLEGFVSPNRYIGNSTKFAVSAGTAVLLVVYLSLGRRRPTVLPGS